MSSDIERIVLDIVQKCERQRVHIPHALAAFVAKAVILENSERFRLDRKLFKADVEELVNLSVARLTEKDSPKLETLRMQVAFDSVYVKQHDALEAERAALAKGYSELEREVCAAKAKSAKDVATFDKIQRSAIQALLKRTDQDPTDEMLQREVAAALESVLPRANLHVFSELAFLEKKARLLDLHDYVLGIRLFNLRIGKGGLGLGNTASEAVQGSHELLSLIDHEISDSELATKELSTVITWGTTLGPEKALKKQIPVVRLQQELVNRRQFQTFLLNVRDEAQQALEKAMETLTEFEAEMDSVQEMVSRRSAVPKEAVYPRFANIAKAWTAGWELLRRIRAMRIIWQELLQFKLPPYSTQLTEDLVVKARKAQLRNPFPTAPEPTTQDKQTLSEDRLDFEDRPPSRDVGVIAASVRSRPGKTSGPSDDQSVPIAASTHDTNVVPRRVTRESNPEILSLPVEFSGYCPVTFIDRDWLLLPGDPSIGSILFRGKTYAFTDLECMKLFIQNPNHYIEAVVLRAQKHTELINLLALEEHFPSNVLHMSLTGLGEKRDEHEGKATSDAACQTVLHIVEKNIDFQYDFNEWSLRRKALQLTNMRRKATHSMQTEASHFRRENDSQTWLPKDSDTQTATSTGTVPIKTIRYLTGLRGHPDQITDVVYQDIEVPGK